MPTRSTVFTHMRSCRFRVQRHQEWLSKLCIAVIAIVAMFGATTVSASAAQAAPSVVFIAPDGSDTTGIGTNAKPFKTLQKATQAVAVGGIVRVKGGRYNITRPERIFVSGQPGNPLVIKAVAGQKPIFDGGDTVDTIIQLSRVNHVIVDGLVATKGKRRGISVWDSNSVVIRNSEVSYVGERAIGGSGNYLFFANNHVHHASMDNKNAPGNVVWAVAMSTWSRPGGRPSTNIVYRNNKVHDSWGEGIGALFAENVLIEGNTVYGSVQVVIASGHRRCRWRCAS